jgi:hypothetical protein
LVSTQFYSQKKPGFAVSYARLLETFSTLAPFIKVVKSQVRKGRKGFPMALCVEYHTENALSRRKVSHVVQRFKVFEKAKFSKNEFPS